MTASDGLEEREYYIKLRNEILSIGALEGWITPDSVIVADNIKEAFTGDKGKFRHLHISITDTLIEEESHKFGLSGQMTFISMINIVARNDERAFGPLPAKLVGISSGPSLAICSGALLNGLHDSTLGGWCWITDVGISSPIEDEEIPEGCIGRQFSFTAIKEVER